MGIDQLGRESRAAERKRLRALAKEAFRCNAASLIDLLGSSCCMSSPDC